MTHHRRDLMLDGLPLPGASRLSLADRIRAVLQAGDATTSAVCAALPDVPAAVVVSGLERLRRVHAVSRQGGRWRGW